MGAENMEQRTDYMTTKEAVAMWDVFLRQVQHLLAKKKDCSKPRWRKIWRRDGRPLLQES
jgi:hypothetical protein